MPDELVLTVCMGSACHQMGAFQVVERLKELLAEHGLQQTVTLKGAFCMENCSEGVVMEIQGRRLAHIRPETLDTVFEEQILPCFRERTS
jgi:NADH:ubiquinone oxidoreductase subunit E